MSSDLKDMLNPVNKENIPWIIRGNRMTSEPLHLRIIKAGGLENSVTLKVEVMPFFFIDLDIVLTIAVPSRSV